MVRGVRLERVLILQINKEEALWGHNGLDVERLFLCQSLVTPYLRNRASLCQGLETKLFNSLFSAIILKDGLEKQR